MRFERTQQTQIYNVFEKNETPLLSPKVHIFMKNDPNKSCRDHEVLSFVDLKN